MLRFVLYGGNVYCIDTLCYHAGGALSVGDIEEVDGTPCITCPIHQFRFSLEDGRQAVYTYDVVDDKVGPCYLHMPPDPPKQRVHDVKQEGSTVLVKLNKSTDEFPSDRLAYRGEVYGKKRIHAVIGEAKTDESKTARERAPTLPPSQSPARSRAPTLPGKFEPPSDLKQSENYTAEVCSDDDDLLS
eukprot:TRINITY_DN4496_c1_g1_i1.p1 TRINITY_DN4496_c1_g1~~TRINITY_DN4496_c1_g1_i1.p1  ORF type:complete len:187 (+),score=26.97 TRINITY_DN4496_c1_g1_i1:130-690(+)